MGGPSQTLHICATELRAEWRNRQVITTMVLLAGLTVVTFGFAGKAGSSHLAPPALWVSLVLAAAAGIAQTITRHEASSVTTALRLGGAGQRSIFLGRLTAFYLLLSVTAGLCWALTALIFGGPTTAPARLAALLALGTLGLAAVGITIASAISGAASGPARLVPLLLLPLALPVVLLGAKGTWGLTTTAAPEALGLMGLMDALLVGAGLWMTSKS